MSYSESKESSGGNFSLDISDPLDIQPLGRYADAGCCGGNGFCLAGDIAYYAGCFRLDVLDIRDPPSPALLHSVPTTSSGGCLDRAGDFLFCGWNGLHGFQVFDRLVDKTHNVAQSLALPSSGADLCRIRLEAVQ